MKNEAVAGARTGFTREDDMTHERVDRYIQLAELERKRLDGRRQDEWKITLAVWAVLVGAIVTPESSKIPVSLAALVVVAYALLWVWPLWFANENNRMLIDHYSREAEKMVLNQYYVPPPRPAKLEEMGWSARLGVLWDPWSWFHIVTTAVIATAFAVLRLTQ
jgi:hypothetical protein